MKASLAIFGLVALVAAAAAGRGSSDMGSSSMSSGSGASSVGKGGLDAAPDVASPMFRGSGSGTGSSPNGKAKKEKKDKGPGKKTGKKGGLESLMSSQGQSYPWS